MKFLLLACTPALLLTACASTPRMSASPTVASQPATPTVDAARIQLAPASGSLVSGRVGAMAMDGGVHFTGEIGGLAPNSTHGLHVHETGDCSAADASSAGAHFNPTAKPHGDPRGHAHHAGDIPNLAAGPDGVARVDVHVAGLTLGGPASTSILGRALVVHAQADDYASQPAGNSGTRVACGVIRTGG